VADSQLNGIVLRIGATQMSEPLVQIENAVKRFKTPAKGILSVLDGLGIAFAKGEFVCLLGPSGCGKSILLNAIAGQEQLDAGQIRIGGTTKPIAGESLRVAMVWQSDSLLPWKTAQANVEFSLLVSGIKGNQRQQRALKWLQAVGLQGFEAYYPAQLSEGMRQRVSLAAALSIEPDLLLMDEPFGALDVYTKLQIEKEVVRLWEAMDATIIMVTHDVQEAVALADRVVMLTARPTTVAFETTIDLPRPRDLDRIYGDPQFHTKVSELWQALTNPG